MLAKFKNDALLGAYGISIFMLVVLVLALLLTSTRSVANSSIAVLSLESNDEFISVGADANLIASSEYHFVLKNKETGEKIEGVQEHAQGVFFAEDDLAADERWKLVAAEKTKVVLYSPEGIPFRTLILRSWYSFGKLLSAAFLLSFLVGCLFYQIALLKSLKKHAVKNMW